MHVVWVGPLIGVFLGYGLAGGGVLGLIGAGAGAMLGRKFDIIVQLSDGLYQMSHRQSSEREGDIQKAFFECTFLCLGRITKCDGYVCEAEIRWTQQVMARMALPAEQKQAAIALFDRGKNLESDISAELLNFQDKCGRRISLLQMFMEILVQAALVDGDMDQREWAELAHIAGAVRFRADRLEQLVRRTQAFHDFNRKQTNGSASSKAANHSQRIANAYRILGLSVDVSDGELKKTYRRLMNQHHPDKLLSKGLPESMVDMAKERTQAIRAAYEEVKAERDKAVKS